jgi:hypothetical protein
MSPFGIQCYTLVSARLSITYKFIIRKDFHPTIYVSSLKANGTMAMSASPLSKITKFPASMNWTLYHSRNGYRIQLWSVSQDVVQRQLCLSCFYSVYKARYFSTSTLLQEQLETRHVWNSFATISMKPSGSEVRIAPIHVYLALLCSMYKGDTYSRQLSSTFHVQKVQRRVYVRRSCVRCHGKLVPKSYVAHTCPSHPSFWYKKPPLYLIECSQLLDSEKFVINIMSRKHSWAASLILQNTERTTYVHSVLYKSQQLSP